MCEINKMEEKLVIRGLLRFFFKKGVSAVTAAKEICSVEGENSVTERTAQFWFQRFRSGDLSLQDKPRTGRPISTDIESLHQAIEAGPSKSTRDLSGELNISQSSVVRHLHKLGKSYKSCRVVPHELTPEQAQRRIDVCRRLLENPIDDRFFKRIVTCDEKWVYFRNPDMEKQWLSRGQVPEPVVKRNRFEKKVMLCLWWNFEGPVYWELISDGRGITAELFAAQLERVYAALSEKYPALVNRTRVLLQMDNAPPHTASLTKKKIAELEGIELLPHPAYSPDLAPSDYYIFRALAHFLRKRQFNNLQDVENGIRDFFASKTKDWYRQGIKELAARWVLTIEHNGLYFEY